MVATSSVAGIVDLPLLAEARPELLSAAAASATESSEPPSQKPVRGPEPRPAAVSRARQQLRSGVRMARAQRVPARLSEDASAVPVGEQTAAAGGGTTAPFWKLAWLEPGQRASDRPPACPDLALDQVGHRLHVVELADIRSACASSRVRDKWATAASGGRGRARAARGRSRRADPAPDSRCERRSSTGCRRGTRAVGVAVTASSRKSTVCPKCRNCVGVFGLPERLLAGGAGAVQLPTRIELAGALSASGRLLSRPRSRARATARSSSRRAVS